VCVGLGWCGGGVHRVFGGVMLRDVVVVVVVVVRRRNDVRHECHLPRVVLYENRQDVENDPCHQ